MIFLRLFRKNCFCTKFQVSNIFGICSEWCVFSVKAKVRLRIINFLYTYNIEYLLTYLLFALA